MKILSYRYFEGPNIHCLSPVAEAEVDLDDQVNARTDKIPGFLDTLLTVLPGLRGHHCSQRRPGGFVERLIEGTYLGHVVEHVTLEILTLVGEQVFYGKTRTVRDTTVRIVYETESRRSGFRALEEAMGGVDEVLSHRPCRLRENLSALRDELAQYRIGPSTRAIVEAARRRGIPVARLDDQSLVRLGQGARQVLIRATLTGRTPAIAVDRAQDKRETKDSLKAAAIAVPDGVLVASEQEAEAVLERWSGPLVVKPASGHHGDGITMNVHTAKEIRSAVRVAQVVDSAVMVERQIPGRAYRLLVVGDQMVAAAERIPPSVTGDGVHSLRMLIDRLNQDPRRGMGHSFPMTRVDVDPALMIHLAQQDLTLESIPEDGVTVTLRAAANLSSGAFSRDVTDDVHADLARDAVRAAQVVGLDVAGVDIVTPSLNASLREAGGAIVEVNAAPGIRMHEQPAWGMPRRVGDAIVRHLFPDGQCGRIPVIAVTGTNGKTTVARMLTGILAATGRKTGMATTDGIWIGGVQVARGDLTGPWSARLILNDPEVEAAVLETARGGMARGGLGFDDCDVAIVTNIGLDHLGQDGIENLDDLVHLKSLVVEVVRPGGAAVLNADDSRVLEMASRTDAEVILFSAREDNLTVKKHLLEGGRAVYVKRGALVFGQSDHEMRLVSVRQLPVSLKGIATINVANAAAAAAAGLAIGVSPRLAAKALLEFPPGGQGVNQGRLEVVRGADVTVLIDYGHNAPAATALGAICRSLTKKCVVTVLGLPGDRRDVDLVATSQTVASFSDKLVIREDYDLRGRPPGAVADILARTVQEAGIASDHVRVILDEGEAVTQAILDAPPGSLVLVLYERYHVVKEAVMMALAQREQQMANKAIAKSLG